MAVTEDDDAGMSLSFADGRVALSVRRRELGALASLERLEVDVPNARIPLDLGSRPDRFRNRRCRLQAAVVTVDEARLLAALSQELLRLSGVTGLRLSLGDGHVLVRARATAGARDAEFTARAVLSAAHARRVRVTIEDVRVYGHLPIPAPLLGSAILNASGATTAAGAGARRAAARWAIEIDPLDLALVETFAVSGRRLPDVSTARLRAATVSPAGITLDWAGEPASGAGQVDEITATSTPPPFEEAEGLLARGDFAGALAGYRQAARKNGGDWRADRRVLEILLASPGSFDEAEAQAARIAERWQGQPVAATVVALARAVIAAERGDADGAAEAYARIAEDAARAGEAEDAALARAAAAATRGEGPATGGAGEGTGVREDAATQKMTVLAVALAEAEQAEASQQNELAGAALRRALEIVTDGAERADLARRLAAVCERQGDEEGAVVALRTYLETAAPGPAVAGAWQRLVALYARRGDPQAAARTLIASADDARTGSSEQERGEALVAAAEILRRRVGLAGDAVVLLERAIALDPHHGEALDAMESLAREGGDWERVAEVLERKVGATGRGPIEQKDLLVRLADVYDQQLARPDRARDAHERALRLDAGFRASLIWLGRDAWVRGDAAAGTLYYQRLAAGENADPPATPAEREETHVRLGTLARRAGDDVSAERELTLALASVPDSSAALDLLIEIFETHGRFGDLAEALGKRASPSLGPGARTDLLRRQAAAYERAGQAARAAGVLRALADQDAGALRALERLAETVSAGGDPAALPGVLEALTEALMARGNVEAADRVFAARVEIAPSDAAAAALTTERARIRLMGPGGAAAALSLLRQVPLAALPEEGLVLRADLGERQASLDDALPALEELRTRAADNAATIQEIDARIADLNARTKERATGSVDELEQALTTDPTNSGAAEELAGLYAQITDPYHRAEALSGLLRRALGLSPERRKTIYAALGASAEASGDLERAEQAYWRAVTIEAEPALRANYLVSHARVLLARGETQTAMSELEEAISKVPHHPGALTVLADLTFRAHDWTRARQLYDALDATPEAADVIPRELLVQRRAVLADAQGDSADAEAFYRELAILNPRHADARRALAEIALGNGDFIAAAQRLEEVLRLLPTDALDQLLDVRQRLGAVYVHLGDWDAARHFLELVLAQDPSRVAALELLVEVYERLSLFREAAQACARLSRLYFEPARRAAILYRQGEILRAYLDDDSAAFDAFLKSADLDPRFVPTMVRLVHYFWANGDWGAVGDVAGDLEAAGFSPATDVEVAGRLALGSALAGRAAPPWKLTEHPFEAALAARLLAETGLQAGRRAPAELDLALVPVLEWAAGDAGLERTLTAMAETDPAHVGALRALGRLAERADRTALARAAYALVAFAEPDDAITAAISALGPAPAASAEAMRVGGPGDHPSASGPLRRALASLAGPLLGFGATGPAPAAAEGNTLRPPHATGLERLGALMKAPPFVAIVDEGERARVAISVVATRPAALRVTAAAADLSEHAWAFVAGRALEELRSGLAGLRGLSPAEVKAVLLGAQAALTRRPGAGDRAEAAARWLAEGEPAAALPAGGERDRLVDDIGGALQALTDWEAFLEGASATACRIGLLACGSPSDALALLAREDVLLAQGDPNDAEGRRAFLRSGAARELARFMLSAEYAKALGPG
jgi:tetratricopeptide (TPR) repeat protein